MLAGRMCLDVGRQVVGCLVWSVALCAADAWMVFDTDVGGLRRFRLWLWIGVERVGWVLSVGDSGVLGAREGPMCRQCD